MFALHKIKLWFSRCPRTALQIVKPDFENWFSWRKDPPSVWARGLLDGEGMNRNSGLTTLSDSSIALSEDEKKAGEGQGSKKLFHSECARVPLWANTLMGKNTGGTYFIDGNAGL